MRAADWFGHNTTRRRAGALLLAGSALLVAGCEPDTRGAPPRPATPVADDSTVLTHVAWLRRNGGDTAVRIVDARPATEYDKGHIPGAISLPVAETFDPARDKNYPDTVDRLAALFGSKGIAGAGSRARVVFYDNGRETPAARLFWTLDYLGHHNASVLDGGLAAWRADGGALSTIPTLPASVPFTASVQASRLHTKEDCERMLGTGAGGAGRAVMLDSRSPEEWRGDDVRAKYGGRIPGAINVDWRENFGPDGRFKPVETLRSLYAGQGVTPDKEVVAYCQTGQRSAVTYLVLRFLGYPRVANYAGSWVEWGNDPSTPKAMGA